MNKENLEVRLEAFNKEFKILAEKYNIILNAMPFITSDGRIGAELKAFDSDEVEKAKLKVENPGGEKKELSSA